MLSLLGWFDGITAIQHFINSMVLGLFFLIKGRKLKANLLIYAGLTTIVAGFSLGPQIIDFFTVLLTANNNPNNVLLSISYVWWMFIAEFCIFFVFWKLIIPEKKWLLICVGVLCVSTELFLLFTPSSIMLVVYPINPGVNLIQIRAIVNPINLAIIAYIAFIAIFAIVGFFIKSIRSEGVMRRKYLFLSIAVSLILIVTVIEVLLDLGYGIIVTRISIFCSGFFWFLGLREESETKIKAPKKEVGIKDSLIRLTKRPEHITEEEVTFHKEQKICLVCKGGISRVSYICPECSALYCVKCSEVLSSQENACWICDEPFDESKPSKPFSEDKEDIDVEISDDTEEELKIVK